MSTNTQREHKPLFLLSKIDEEISEESPEYKEIASLFAEARSFDEIISRWMDRKRSRELVFTCGTSEEPETLGQPAVFVVIEQGDCEIAEAECLKEDLRQFASDKMIIDDARFIFEGNSASYDEAWQEERDRRFGIAFDETFGENQIARENVQKLLLSYLLGKIPSTIELFFVDDESLDHIEAEKQEDDPNAAINRNYVCMNLSVAQMSDDGARAIGMSSEFVSFFLE